MTACRPTGSAGSTPPAGAPEPWIIAFGFREEAHAIEATLAGQGVTLCSDIVVADELASDALVKAFDFGLPGYAFYPVFAPDHPRWETLEAFVHWLRGWRRAL
jgi:DNA-binding transcriptional LysR family regulator